MSSFENGAYDSFAAISINTSGQDVGAVIIELGVAIVKDRKITHEAGILCKPSIEVGEDVYRNNGLTKAQAQGALSVPDVINEIAKTASLDVLVHHHQDSTRHYLEPHLPANESRRWHDALFAVRGALINEDIVSIKQTASALGLTLPNSLERAGSRASAIAQIFNKVVPVLRS